MSIKGLVPHLPPTYMVEDEGNVLVPAEGVEGGVGGGEHGQVPVQIVLVYPLSTLQQLSKLGIHTIHTE